MKFWNRFLSHFSRLSQKDQQALDQKPPVHVAIIMDGNSRWARARGYGPAAGHAQGASVARDIVTAAGRLGIRYLTLYAFSSENWQRSPSEVADLMGLLRRYLSNEIHSLLENNVRLIVIGDRSRLPADILALVVQSEAKTSSATGLTLVMALSYGSREEITRAARTLAAKAVQKQITVNDIDEQAFAAALYTCDLPDPDFLIRTSGEQRISNFLMWQLSYAELYFTPVLWPDFKEENFIHALAEYGKRVRRFGRAACHE